jgi:hypothetical protein
VKPDLKTMLDDVRARDSALLQLILFTDRQAMALFRIYASIAVAAAAAAAAAFGSGTAAFLMMTRWSLLAMALVLVLACIACLRAMVPAGVGLPGRGADFWQWGVEQSTTDDAFVAAYLNAARKAQDGNRRTNELGAIALMWAKRLGIAAPLVGLAVGAIEFLA